MTSISLESIESALKSASEDYARSLATWYPQHGDNAPAERNLTLALALALRQRAPSLRMYAEPSLGPSTNERVDLVGYDPEARDLIVVEAKRFLEKSAVGLLHDVERIGRFVPANDNAAVGFSTKLAVLVTQTNTERNQQWWDAAQPNDGDGATWTALAEHLALARRGGFVSSAQVYAWPSRRPTHRRWVLWAAWVVPRRRGGKR